VAADSAYGEQDGFRSELAEAGLPFVMALKPRRGTQAYGPDAHTRRLRVATADPGTLPAKATWYLVTNLPRPGGPREAGSPAAGPAKIVWIYGIRHWTGQS
jgi:hypothetical protein